MRGRFRGPPRTPKGKGPVFQQRHYERIAKTLAAQAGARDLWQSMELAELVDRLADLFEQDNPSFKRELFHRAVWRNGQ